MALTLTLCQLFFDKLKQSEIDAMNTHKSVNNLVGGKPKMQMQDSASHPTLPTTSFDRATEDSHHYNILRKEYTQIIDSYHTLACEYKKIQENQKNMAEENKCLKESLQKCEQLLKHKMQEETQT